MLSDALLLAFAGAGLSGPDPLRAHMTIDVSTGTDFGHGQHEVAFRAAIISSAADTAATGWLIAPPLFRLLWRRGRPPRREDAPAAP